MRCRQCGSEIPQRYLKLDAFKCPSCGKLYRRKQAAQQTIAPDGSRKPAQAKRRKSSAGSVLRSILMKKLWILPVWAWLAIVLFLIVYPEDSTVQDAAVAPEIPVYTYEEHTEAPTVQPTAEAKVFDTIWDYAADDAWGSKYGGTEYELLAQTTREPRLRFKVGSKGEFCMRVSEFCKSLTSAAEYNTTDYDAVRCWGWMELVDIYGNASEENVFRITVRKSEIDKINWDYFITDNIIQIGEDYWEANNIVY